MPVSPSGPGRRGAACAAPRIQRPPRPLPRHLMQAPDDGTRGSGPDGGAP